MTTEADRITGRFLREKWEVDVKHALYREDGKWYQPLTSFPGAYFDANGYVLFTSEDKLEKPFT
jgi:hypothetical protein